MRKNCAYTQYIRRAQSDVLDDICGGVLDRMRDNEQGKCIGD